MEHYILCETFEDLGAVSHALIKRRKRENCSRECNRTRGKGIRVDFHGSFRVLCVGVQGGGGER